MQRVSLDAVCDDLRELHDGRCFYCCDSLREANGKRLQIDHFVPWSRHPENAVDNLVPAHEQCNNRKRDFLAARGHVQRWRERLEQRTCDLRVIADRAGFEYEPSRVLSIARSIYVRLPSAAQLWVRGDDFEAVGNEPFAALLTVALSA